MMRVLVPTKLHAAGLAVLEGTPGLTVDCRPGLSKTELTRALARADAVVIRSDVRLDSELIGAAKKLRVIGRAGVGVENVDVTAATERGIAVINTPGANTNAVVELVFALMLALVRKITIADTTTKAGRWEKKLLGGTELSGKTLGLIGFGRIGRGVAERARVFGMTVIASDPFLTQDVASRFGVELVGFGAVLKRSDVISLHVPLTDKTRGLIGASELRRMKKSAVLINCARGGIVDEAALAKTLKSNGLGGAGLDVFAAEPPTSTWFSDLPNVVVTPHLGASTAESQAEVGRQIAQLVVRALTEGVYENAINLPVADPERMAELQPGLTLAARLGRLLAVLADGPAREMAITATGTLRAEEKLIAAAVASGFFTGKTHHPVSLVNAIRVADEFGVKVLSGAGAAAGEETHGLAVEMKAGRRTHSVVGALYGGGHPTVVAIDGYTLEVHPFGRHLIFTNRDRPGVIGAVGTLLGEAKINVASWQLGRKRKGGLALALVGIDHAVPVAVLRALGELPHMKNVRVVDWPE